MKESMKTIYKEPGMNSPCVQRARLNLYFYVKSNTALMSFNFFFIPGNHDKIMFSDEK